MMKAKTAESLISALLILLLALLLAVMTRTIAASPRSAVDASLAGTAIDLASPPSTR